MRLDHAKLMDPILAGVPAAQVKDRMIALDNRRQQLEAELSASLIEELSDPAKNLEVTGAIRALVDRIVLTPVP